MPDNEPFYLSHAFSSSAAHWLASIARAGRNGVDLFFVLSAYLITELLLREKATTGDLKVGSFYLRRILRIWPLYFLAIAVGICVTLIDKQQHLTLGYIAAFLLLAGNWVTALWGPPASIVSPLWSVSLEEQFYLIWPPLVRKASTASIRSYAIGMIAVAWLSRWFFFNRGWGTELWVNSFTRLDPIALGILLAIALRGELPKIPRWKRLGLLIGGLSLSFGVRLLCDLARSFKGIMIGYPLMAIASLGILVAVLGWDNKLLQNKALVYLGKISYGLYVYHLLGLRISYWLFKGHTARIPGFLLFCIIGFVFTVLISSISYQLFERPFLTLKSRRYTVVNSRPD